MCWSSNDVSMSLIIKGLYHSLDFVSYRGTKGDKAGHLKFTLWAPGGEVPSDRGASRPGQETGREAGQSTETVVLLNWSTLFIFLNDDCQQTVDRFFFESRVFASENANSAAVCHCVAMLCHILILLQIYNIVTARLRKKLQSFQWSWAVKEQNWCHWAEHSLRPNVSHFWPL